MVRDHPGTASEPNGWAEALAVPLELTAHEDETLSGRWRGEVVGVARHRPGCRVHVALDAPLPPGFLLRRQKGEGLRDQRGPDLVIGDPELDPLLQIQCAHPAAAIRILKDPAVKTAVLGAFQVCSPVVTPQELIISLETDSVEGIRAALGAGTRLAVALRAAAGQQLESLARSTRDTKEELVYLPSQRFVKGPELPALATRRAMRHRARGARALRLSGIAVFSGFVASSLNLSISGLLFSAAVVIALPGFVWLARGSRCIQCGHYAEHLALPFAAPVRCEQCGTVY
jgi:hypothetical protein